MRSAARIRTPTLTLIVGGAAALWLFGFQTSVGGPPTDPPAAAMTAELAAVRDPSERRRFAAGCVQAALFPPSGERAPAWRRAAVVVVVALIVGSAVSRALPALLVFVVSFIALIGALAVVAAARSGPLHRTGASRTARATAGHLTAFVGLAAVAGCIAVTGYFVARSRRRRSTCSRARLAGAAPPAVADNRSGWPRGSPSARRFSSVLDCWWPHSSACARWPGWTRESSGTCYLAPIIVIIGASAWTSALRRSRWTGVQTAVWTALLASLVTYAAGGVGGRAVVRAGQQPHPGQRCGPPRCGRGEPGNF